MGYICSQIHGYNLLYIILSTNFEVAAHILGATDLAQCEIMNCCDLLMLGQQFA